MRKPFTVIINLLLTALMIVMLPGVQLTAEDGPKKPQENVV